MFWKAILFVLIAACAFAQVDVPPNPFWTAAFGRNPKLDGTAMEVGDTIQARYEQFDVRTQRIKWFTAGQDTVHWAYNGDQEKVYGYMIIYGDDPYTSGQLGPLPGDSVWFWINHKRCNQFIVYAPPTQDSAGNGQFDGLFHQIEVFTEACKLSGDLNNDGTVDLSDFIAMLDYIVFDNNYVCCIERADINCDGLVDIGDIMYMGDYLFLDGRPPQTCESK